MFKNITIAHIAADPASTEELADTLYEIGKDLFTKKQYETAVRWLGRAYDVLSEQEQEMLSHNAIELRLAIMQLLSEWVPGALGYKQADRRQQKRSC